MKTEEIIDRLRHPQKYRQTNGTVHSTPLEEVKISSPKSHSTSNLFAFLITLGVLGMAVAVLVITLHTKKRAENLAASLNPAQLKGLASEAEFDPRKIVTYVNINELGEGGDRVPTVEELGSTIPILSRYNYQAITKVNYGVIGAAPWALSANVEANLKDKELLRYLLNHQEVANAFVKRPDTAPLLEDPQLLEAFAQDNASLQAFFNSALVKEVLADTELTLIFGKSRLMSTILVSKAVKYYRDRPKEAARIIHNSPVLKQLTQNPSVRKAVQENYYLKSIAAQLLDNAPVKKTSSRRANRQVDEEDEEAAG